MARVYNFSAGPATLPEEVLQEAAAEMMDYQGCGMSVMEISHRTPIFDKIIGEAEQDLRDLMNIPDNYKVLFLQGGAYQQFAAVPMNLMKNKLVVNFDCVGNGDQIVLILKDAATRLSQFDALKSTLISNEKYTVHYLQNKSSVANSDHKSFLCGVGVMACNKGSRVRFYTGRIHTARDTVANSENIYFLADKISRFIDSM